MIVLPMRKRQIEARTLLKNEKECLSALFLLLY